jgi:hypothetical protein
MNFKNYTIMKKSIKILICATLATLPYFGFAQYIEPWNSDMDVNGLYIGSVYTYAQVTAQWGTPTNYRSNTSEFGVNETYHYSTNLFRFSDDGIFNSFRLKTPAFVVYSSKSGGFKVGDEAIRLKTIGLISNQTLIRASTSEYILDIPSGDERFTVGYTNGIITYISYISSL